MGGDEKTRKIFALYSIENVTDEARLEIKMIKNV